MAFAPSSRTEAKIFVKHALAEMPNAKFALLYQNDDFGKDFIDGLRDILGNRYNSMVTAASYEITDATVDSQLISLKASNADVLITGATAKFGTQSIRKVHDLGWKVRHYVTMGASSVVASIIPAGKERAKGIITSAFIKDSSDPAYAADPAMKDYTAFMAKHYDGGNPDDAFNTFAYTVSKVMCHVLEQCKGDFRRDTIMREANNIKDLEVPLLLPGIKVNTSPTNHHPLRQVQLMRWDGERWVLFGGVISDTSI
jgi:branched-chain amino acid transport system substrate-binding protein